MDRTLSSVLPDLPAVIVEAVRHHLAATGIIAPGHPFDTEAACEAAENVCGSLRHLGEQIALYGAGLE